MSSSTQGPEGAAQDPIVADARTQQRFVEELQDVEPVVWEMDARTWTFTYVSERAERIFGYPLERWTEPGFWQEVLVDPRDRDWCTGFCLTATNDRRNHAFLYRARTADGRTLWLKDVVRVLPDEEGAPTLLRGVMQDVTRSYADSAAEGRALDFDDPDLAPLRRMLVA